VTRVLVTGAAGFAGRHLLDLLVKSGHDITAWSRSPIQPNPANPGRIHWHQVDLLDAAAVARAVGAARPSGVFHLGASAHVGQSWGDATKTMATNVLGTHNVLRGLSSAGLTARVLIPSSAYVYRPSAQPLREDSPIGPSSPYALSKLAQEMLGLRAIQEDGQEVVVARSFNHTGPGQSAEYSASGFARQIALIEAGRMPPTISVGNLDASRDLSDVRDTVRAYHTLLARGATGEIYNVCSGTAVPIRDVLQALVNLSRSKVAIAVDPARYRPSDTPVLLGDPGKLKKQTGWVPEVPLQETLSNLLEYWRKEIQ